MDFLLQIVQNALLLTLLGVGYYFIEVLKPGFSNRMTMAGHGLIFGLIAFLVTSTPLSLSDGATVDARAAPVILAGYVGGPLAAIIAAVFGGVARGLVGGSFAFSGVAVFALYALLGIGFWFMRGARKERFLDPRLIAGLCSASFLAAASMFFLISPSETAWAWVRHDLPYIIVANGVGIVFASLMLGFSESILAKARKITDVTNRLRLAKRAGHFGIWDFDIATGKLTWDARSMELHGISPDTFEGSFKDWAKNIHPEDIARAEVEFSAALESSDVFDIEYRVIHDDGSEKRIRGDAILLRDPKGKAIRVVGTNLDLTEIRATQRKLQEAQLVAMQAQKFDTIGQLTGGVAHDFNNLLAVIMGNLELIDDEISKAKPNRAELRSLIDSSIEATQHGADLTQNMLAYARQARLNPTDIDLNEVVRETESWMRRTIPTTVHIEMKLTQRLWLTMADRSSLQSALVNLLVNARDAFSGSGEILIETTNAEIGTEQSEDMPPGQYVTLAVQDNGRGIPPNDLSSIFDPFFSTKGVGEGSGLGLSMVQGFVEQSGGAIRVTSELGVGTTFKIFFPALPHKEHRVRKEVETLTEPSFDTGAGPRILLVEDREEVLLILRKMLQRAGYQVVPAHSGDEGYRVFCADTDFDLVVTDVAMPGELQGPAMAAKMRDVKQDLGFVFISGYASEEALSEFGLQPNDIRLMKPVSRKDLLQAVSKALMQRAVRV